MFFISKSSSRNGGNGLSAGAGTVWGWWERLEGMGGNGFMGQGRERFGGCGRGMVDAGSGLSSKLWGKSRIRCLMAPTTRCMKASNIDNV